LNDDDFKYGYHYIKWICKMVKKWIVYLNNFMIPYKKNNNQTLSYCEISKNLKYDFDNMFLRNKVIKWNSVN
jgi:hypothetical protein